MLRAEVRAGEVKHAWRRAHVVACLRMAAHADHRLFRLLCSHEN